MSRGLALPFLTSAEKMELMLAPPTAEHTGKLGERILANRRSGQEAGEPARVIAQLLRRSRADESGSSTWSIQQTGLVRASARG